MKTTKKRITGRIEAAIMREIIKYPTEFAFTPASTLITHNNQNIYVKT